MSWWSLQHNVQVNLAVMWICCRSDMIVATYASMSMRLPSTLLKSAVYLLLGFSTVFGGAAANALTFNWSWTATSGDDGNGADLTGTVVTGTIDNLADNTLNKTGMTATFLSGFNVGQTLDFVGGYGIQVTNGSVVVPGLEAVFTSSDGNYQLQLADSVTGSTPGNAEDYTAGSMNIAYLSSSVTPTFSRSLLRIDRPAPLLRRP